MLSAPISPFPIQSYQWSLSVLYIISSCFRIATKSYLFTSEFAQLSHDCIRMLFLLNSHYPHCPLLSIVKLEQCLISTPVTYNPSSVADFSLSTLKFGHLYVSMFHCCTFTASIPLFLTCCIS